jgi:hypothetical protein
LVHKNQRAFGNKCFHGRFRRARTTAFGEKFFDVRQHLRIRDQLFAEQFRDEVTREVIRSRAESAGRDHQIRTTQSFAHGLLDLAAGIGHGDLPRDNVAEVGEAPAKPLLVRVQDAAQHQFAAGIHEFNIHLGSFERVQAAGKSALKISAPQPHNARHGRRGNAFASLRLCVKN